MMTIGGVPDGNARASFAPSMTNSYDNAALEDGMFDVPIDSLKFPGEMGRNQRDNNCGVGNGLDSKCAVYTIPEKSPLNGMSNGKKSVTSDKIFQNGERKKMKNSVFPKDGGSSDYDPYKQKDHKHPTTYTDTMFHLLKASLGTGILAMPNAFRNSGYIVGTVGTLFIGFLCTYNIHTLISSEYELCRRRRVPNMTFPTTAQAAFEEGPECCKWFAPHAKNITNLFLIMYQIGSSSIYAVFIAENMKHVIDSYTDGDLNVRLILLYILAPMILICWVRNLKFLVPFSTIANVLSIISFVFIFYYIFKDGRPPMEELKPVGDLRGIASFFGTVLFAMEAIGVIMPLKNQMKNPRHFGSFFGVLNTSMFPITVLYTFIGFLGYLKYNDTTQGSITLNLPSKELLARSVKVLYSFTIYITYALSCYVAFDLMWTNCIKAKVSDSKYKTFWEYSLRTAIALVTFVLAVAIPNLELFISFIGALCLSTMGVAFPPIIEMLLYWSHYKNPVRFTLFLIKNILILIIAILAFTIGVSSSVREIVNS